MKQWEIRGVTVDAPALQAVGSSVDLLDPLRVLVDQVPALFWTTDTELRISSSLGAELERLGLGANQLVGTALPDLFDGPQAMGVLESHRRALAGTSVFFHINWPLKSFRARVAPLKDSLGQIIGTICVAVDDGGQERAGPIWSER